MGYTPRDEGYFSETPIFYFSTAQANMLRNVLRICCMVGEVEPSNWKSAPSNFFFMSVGLFYSNDGEYNNEVWYSLPLSVINAFWGYLHLNHPQ